MDYNTGCIVRFCFSSVSLSCKQLRNWLHNSSGYQVLNVFKPQKKKKVLRVYSLWSGIVAVYVQRVCQGFKVPNKPMPDLQTTSWEAFGDKSEQRRWWMKKGWVATSSLCCLYSSLLVSLVFPHSFWNFIFLQLPAFMEMRQEAITPPRCKARNEWICGHCWRNT